MPATLETRTRWPHRLAVAGDTRARLGDPAATRSGAPVNSAIHARVCPPSDGRRAGPGRRRSGLTFAQPSAANLADGPCDPGIPSALRRAARGVPRSHGPSEGRVKHLRLTFRYSSAAGAVPTDRYVFGALRPRPTIHPSMRRRLDRTREPGSTEPAMRAGIDRTRDAGPPRSNPRGAAGSSEPRCGAVPTASVAAGRRSARSGEIRRDASGPGPAWQTRSAPLRSPPQRARA